MNQLSVYPVGNFMFIVKNKQIQWPCWGLFQFSYEHFQTKFFEELQNNILTQPAITCLKLTIETLEQGVKYVKS